MADTTVELSGGAFQTAQGNVLNDGYLIFYLSQDAQANGNTEICAEYAIKITLDSSGNINTGQNIWPNDVLTPSGTFYTVSGYTAAGELVWGPNSQMVLSSPNPYNVGAWVPGNVNTSTVQITNYDIGIFLPGQYVDSQVVMLYVFERPVVFANNFSPSVAAVGTNPAATNVFTLNKNGTQVGTLTINTNGSTAFSSSAATTNFAVGDVLTVVAPGAIDADLANVGITLSGNILV